MCKYLNKLFDWMSLDGALHILCSLVILLVLAVFFPLWVAIVATVFVGIGKEVYDRISYGLFSWKDVLFDSIGIVLAVLIFLLFKFFYK